VLLLLLLLLVVVVVFVNTKFNLKQTFFYCDVYTMWHRGLLPGTGSVKLPRWYRHLVAGLFNPVRVATGTSEPESHAGGGLAAGTATHAGQVLSEMPDRETYLGPPGWGWAWR
jgi:hypothetical protein